jgi:hypothetical protein
VLLVLLKLLMNKVSRFLYLKISLIRLHYFEGEKADTIEQYIQDS